MKAGSWNLTTTLGTFRSQTNRLCSSLTGNYYHMIYMWEILFKYFHIFVICGCTFCDLSPSLKDLSPSLKDLSPSLKDCTAALCSHLLTIATAPTVWLSSRRTLQPVEAWTPLLLLRYTGCRNVHYCFGDSSLAFIASASSCNHTH